MHDILNGFRFLQRFGKVAETETETMVAGQARCIVDDLPVEGSLVKQEVPILNVRFNIKHGR